MEMSNFMSFSFLQNQEISDGDININGFLYPIFQANGQKAIGPLRDIKGFKYFKPKENENEIFINRVPGYWTENELMKYLMEAGIVYFMRFLVNFTGKSRGTAYVQYIGFISPSVMSKRLNVVFKKYHLYLKASVSYNFRHLKVGNISTFLKNNQLWLLFKQSGCIEYKPLNGGVTFVLKYQNNREACLAKRFLLSHINELGSNAFIAWFDKPKNKISY